jgi:hypothetical protein
MGSKWQRVWAPCLLAAVAGCGGGGGDDDETLLSGDFHAIALEATGTPSNSCRSHWGSAEGSGSMLSFTTTRNLDGTVAGPFDEEYEPVVSPDGTFLLRDPSTDEPVLAGCLSLGGDVAVATAIRSGDLPRLLGMTRETGGAAAGDLSGAYRFVFYTLQAEARSSSGTASFDGVDAGVLDAGAVVNVDGVLVSATLGSPFAYAVAATGRVTTSFVFAGTFEGAIDPSREIALLGGATATGDAPGVLVFVKSATSASNATFSGDYCMVGLSFDFATPAMRSFGGGLVADGAGNATAQGTVNTEGTIAPTLPASATYAVATDGTLTLAMPEGTFVGGVSPSGDVAVVGGPNTGGADPATYLLVRR